MGHVVSKKGIKMTDSKVKAKLEVAAQKSANEVSSFLGFINFYRRFIDRLAQLMSPLYALTKKDVEFS